MSLSQAVPRQARGAFLLTLLSSGVFSAALSFAQETPDPADRFELSPLLVTASPEPRNADDYTTLASALAAVDRLEGSAGNLGDSLAVLTGVQSTGFAPGAGRPVIRGFGGPRIQILQDGLETLDVSASSEDHAVGATGLFARQVEVLRGPGTLLFGGNAIGGVVNVVNETAPRTPPPGGMEGRADLRYDEGREGGLAALEGVAGSERFAVRIGVATELWENYRLPDGYHPPEEEHDHEHDHEEEEGEHHDEDDHDSVEAELDRLPQTFSDRNQFEFGASWFRPQGGRWSVFAARLEAVYGVPGHEHHHDHEDEDDHEHEDDHGDEDDHDHDHEEEDHDGHDEDAHDHEDGVRIDLRSDRAGAAFDVPLDHGFFLRARTQLQYTDYQHQELEGDMEGTRFEREGLQLRSEWTHAPVGGHDGVLGVQLLTESFDARGEEAFTPASETRTAGLFWILEGPREAPLAWQHGVRLDFAEITPENDLSAYRALGFSAASGARWRLAPEQVLSFQASLSQRHPSASELFSDGAHLATGTYDVGDPDLGAETAIGLDLTFRQDFGPLDLTVAPYAYRFFDYIYRASTGLEEDGLPVIEHRQEDALITGLEIEGTVHLIDREQTRAHLSLGFDHVRRERVGDDGTLPRTPPSRLRSTFHFEQGQWGFDATLEHVFKQDRVASDETSTDAYTMLHLLFTFRLEEALPGSRLFVRLSNLTDELAFNHLAYQKEEKPFPGRRLSAGMSLAF